MITGTGRTRQRHLNGLALFAGTMVFLALAIVIGGNLLFDRSVTRPLPDATRSAATETGRTSAPAAATGRTAAPAPASRSG